MNVFKVNNTMYMRHVFHRRPLFIRNLLFKIVHVISIAQTVVLIVQIQFVSVVKIRRLKIRITSRPARREKVSTWASASSTAKMTLIAKAHVSIFSNWNTLDAHVR